MTEAVGIQPQQNSNIKASKYRRDRREGEREKETFWKLRHFGYNFRHS
jgi:hypothetical protein